MKPFSSFLGELSSKSLISYSLKAVEDKVRQKHSVFEPGKSYDDQKKHLRKYNNRKTGLSTASKKLGPTDE